MNLEFYIAKRIHFRQDRKNVSRPAVRIAITGIALGLAVMLIAIAVVIGFKQEIRSKTIGFGGHIQVTRLDAGDSYQLLPVELTDSLSQLLLNTPGVNHIQGYATQPGIMKTQEDFQGIVLKGIDQHFSAAFFARHLVDGEVFRTDSALTKDALISEKIAKLLKLKVGDDFFVYFIQDQVRARKLHVKGIYATHFEEYDKTYILTDIRHLRSLNKWQDNWVSGVEIVARDYDQMDNVNDQVQINLQAYQKQKNAGDMFISSTIRDLYPQIFSWLDLLDMNVWVILILMLAVAGFNMISGLLILILERTTMIGILKSVGATNWSVRKIFLYHSTFLIANGMLWGNVIGLIICAIQYFTHVIPLDPSSYYVAYVPVSFNWMYILLLNFGTFIASVLMMIGPSYLITKILPAKIIRYE